MKEKAQLTTNKFESARNIDDTGGAESGYNPNTGK